MWLLDLWGCKGENARVEELALAVHIPKKTWGKLAAFLNMKHLPINAVKSYFFQILVREDLLSQTDISVCENSVSSW